MTDSDILSAAQKLHRGGKLAEAERAYRAFLAGRPGHPQALHLLGVLLHQSGRFDEAIGKLEKSAQLAPGSAAPFAALSAALYASGRIPESFRAAARATTLQPDDAKLKNLAGHLCQQLGEPGRAMGYLQQAVELAPEFAEAHHNLAIALHTMGRVPDAVASYRRAALLDAQNGQIHFNLGLALQANGDLPAAVEAMQACLDVLPEHVEAQYKLAYFQKLRCDWDAVDSLAPELEHALRQHLKNGGAPMIWPFAINTLPLSADLHDGVAAYLSQQIERRALSVARPEEHQPAARDRLTIGYLSADFRAHAVGGLVYRLFGHHDRERVRVIAYSLLTSADEYQSTVRNEVDEFRDLTTMSIAEAARTIQADALDILVDMSGYTEHARPELLALRPAPIQVSWTGYLNTMQAPFIDYLLADSFVMSRGLAERYTESVVTLPGCFFPGSELPVAVPSTRDACGLPDDRFVFCSFNHTYKLDRTLFACWIEILRQVPDAVLWLYAGGMADVEERLRARAAEQGIEAARLVFAARVGIEQHIARLACADLFLDAFSYNAGATGVSAVQAGLPVLTRTGEQFMSRISTSINRTLGLDELCCSDDEGYVAMAVELATDRDKMAELRKQLQNGKPRLFDLPGRARVLEAVYEVMWRNYCEGRAPEGFCIHPVVGPGEKKLRTGDLRKRRR